ncbi:HugZ family pyridoxamine 5'-phosphate oxidase [Neorhizobium galegae]|uniref:HugZ family pyridoxamine 5'-phosphate oxidase n=1 Tax=Neorhizobium galegae TaxID=399 RepID=UPI000620FE10|nr:pyridoxamine 5'-phosphate oxidase family protein [Neorhizobium galegae]KAB1124523.1 HugZ family protein [Neorhizobium galegae]MCQ1804869.1 pyridoxamine 5'-phosphate oxidase family protein [Neorhizobium galegae]CDZ57721.1 Pyridoxamine 5'-phosphate oxidase-related FMN-binding [Neorhizobium galegae bv. orientalis]
MADEQQTDKPQVLRDTDDDARRLARALVRGARYMALAVLDPETGFPSASRALTGTDIDGVPVILVSSLSGHTKGLVADPRCSLLAGEPGKGDPLAHPRITVQCLAEGVVRDTPEHARVRQRFLDRHPKAALYADFGDFRFFRITPQAASLNGGFGRAYLLTGSDLVIPEPGTTTEWMDLQEKLKNIPEQAQKIAARLGTENGKKWRFGGVDRAGIDLIAGDFQLRHEFDLLAESPQAVLDYVFDIANIR